MRKIIICILLVVLTIPNVAQAKTLALLINGSYVTDGAAPVIINGTTYIPLRNLFENIEFTVEYYPEHKSVLAWYNKGNFRLEFVIGSKKVNIESRVTAIPTVISKEISSAAIMHNGSVYVPLRAFGELLGAAVYYDKYTYTVTFQVTHDTIKQTIYPSLGLPLEGEETSERKKLTTTEIAKLRDRVAYVEVYDNFGQVFATGSGVMVEPYLFVTNHHVMEGSHGANVYLDGFKYNINGWYLFSNKKVDLFGSYLGEKYDAKGFPQGQQPSKFLKYNVDLPEIGEKVYAIGSPKGLENTLTEGIVSGIRESNGVIYIQHTAEIESGSSGGALLNEYGELIGINTLGVPGSTLEFAVPVSYVIEELKNPTYDNF